MSVPIETELTFPTDDSSRRKALAALEDIRKGQKALAEEFAKGSKTLDAFTKDNSALEKKYRDLAKAQKAVDAGFRTQEEQLKDAKKATEEQSKALAELARQEEKAAQEASRLADEQKRISFDRQSQAFDNAGKGAAGVGAIAQLPGLSGAGNIAPIFDVLENAPKLVDAFKGLPEILQATAKGVGLGGLAGNLQSAIPALGATGASVAAIATVALPVVAVLGTLAAGMALLQKHTEEVTEATKKAAEARQLEADTQREIAELLASGDPTDLRQAIEERNQLLVNSGNLAADIAREENALREAGLAYLADIRAGGTGIFSGTKAALEAQQQVVDDLYAASANANIELQAANDALAGVSQESINVATNFEAIEHAQQALIQTTQQYEQALKTQEQTQNQINQLTHQANELTANFAEQNLDRIADETLATQQASEREALEEQFANEDRLAQQAAFQESLIVIEQEGQAKIKSLRQDLSNLATERIAALGEAEAKGNADLDKVRKEYMSDSLKTLEKFQESEKRTQQRGQIERLRLLQDLNDSLSDAQRDNNVIAFLEAQRNGEKELSRQAQDSSIEAKQRADDFARENEERRAALDQRIADIQANIEKEREQINQQFAEREAAINKSIEAEKIAIQERTRAAIAASNEQAANEAKNAERQAQREQLQAQQQEQRDAIVEGRRQREHQEQLSRIEQQKAAQQAALAAILAQIRNLQAQAAAQSKMSSSQSSTGAISSYSTANYGSSNKIGAASGSIKAFASGGIVTGGKPQLIIAGDTPQGVDEMIMPFKRSEGLPIGANNRGSNRGSVNVTYAPVFQSTIGDIVSSTQVSDALREFATAHGQAQVAMLEKWLNPS